MKLVRALAAGVFSLAVGSTASAEETEWLQQTIDRFVFGSRVLAGAAAETAKDAGDSLVSGSMRISGATAETIREFGHGFVLGSRTLVGVTIEEGRDFARRFALRSQALWAVAADNAGQLVATTSNEVPLIWDLAPNRFWWRDAITSGVVIAATSGGATYVCGIGGGLVFGPPGAAIGGIICALAGQIGGGALVRYGYLELNLQLDESAFRVGAWVGGAVGSVVGTGAALKTLRFVERSRFTDYGGFAKEVRRLTRLNERPFCSDIRAFRNTGFELDHIVPVKCAWKMGMTAAEVAAAGNLQLVPCAINRTMGSKGC